MQWDISMQYAAKGGSACLLCFPRPYDFCAQKHGAVVPARFPVASWAGRHTRWCVPTLLLFGHIGAKVGLFASGGRASLYGYHRYAVFAYILTYAEYM